MTGPASPGKPAGPLLATWGSGCAGVVGAADACNRPDVALVGATAAAQHGEGEILPPNVAIELAQFDRVARIEFGAGLKLRMRHARGVGPQSLQPLDPVRARLQHVGKVVGKGRS